MPDLLFELFSEEIPARMQAQRGGGFAQAWSPTGWSMPGSSTKAPPRS